jgi:hypothetical protein
MDDDGAKLKKLLKRKRNKGCTSSFRSVPRDELANNVRKLILLYFLLAYEAEYHVLNWVQILSKTVDYLEEDCC